MKDIKDFLVNPDLSIRDVVARIDQNGSGIALIVDEEGSLLGTITDGDIRRAVLAKVDFDKPILDILDQKESDLYKVPITAPVGTPEDKLKDIMNEYVIRQVPLLDEAGRVVDISLLSEIITKKELPLTAVIMAGGYGTRLGPLTKKVPKPMLMVGNRPIIEIIIERLRESGIKQVNISTNYLAEKIKDHFKDGYDFGVDIEYVDENRPLGTAGALGLMEKPDQTILVINGDILSRIDFRSMLEFHRKYDADLTVGVGQYDIEVPYGVLECEGPLVHHRSEKPKYSFLVNAGIYILEPTVHKFIPSDEYYDMTDLIDRLINEGLKVVSFPVVEYWLDIGQYEDYQKAQKDLNNGSRK